MNYYADKPLFPYARLANDDGSAAIVTHTYRDSYLKSVENSGILDWYYRPLEEQRLADNTSKTLDYRVNLNLKYRVIPSLSAEVLYQYAQERDDSRNRRSQDSWYTRNEINRFTIVNADGALTRPVPLGDILDLSAGNTETHNLRGQLSFEKTLGEDHEINGIAGAELRDAEGFSRSNRYYGYSEAYASSEVVDLTGNYASFINPNSRSNKILSINGLAGTTDRFISYYFNGSWSFKRRYVLSASARTDRSNLFGVKANQKGVPLYSLGLSWNITDEPFFRWKNILSYLRLRGTFGYNGNVDRSLSAMTTAYYLPTSSTGLWVPLAYITNPPNPDLKWERVRTVNLGADFALANSRISGTLEFYTKKGLDLIGQSALAPQTGLAVFKGNTANTKGHGVDASVTSNNIRRRLFQWSTTAIFSYVKDVVSKYQAYSTNTGTDYLSGTNTFPTEGMPIYSMYSFPWAGLNPETGMPRGYLKGEISQDYNSIISGTDNENLLFNGSARPTTFGAVRNNFTYRGFGLSVNISYKLNYFVRRASIQYSTVFNAIGGHGDYALRWQKPGDEQWTSVPAMPASNNSQMNFFYQYSQVLVDRGNHVRLQDISVSYEPVLKWKNKAFKGLKFYAYLNNLAVLWKASGSPLDPDYKSGDALPPARTYSVGINVNF